MPEALQWLAAVGGIIGAVVAPLVAWYTARLTRPKLKGEAADAITEAAERLVRLQVEENERCEKKLAELGERLEAERAARRRDVEELRGRVADG